MGNRLKEVIELLYKIKEEQKNNREKDKIQYCIHILNMIYKEAVWTNCDNCKYKIEAILKLEKCEDIVSTIEEEV